MARAGSITSILYVPPFFILNKNVLALLKYSTRTRSPWGFTFTSDEQELLQTKSKEIRTVIGLICGADGVAAFEYDSYLRIGNLRSSALHIACYRRHGEHYEICGPDGTMNGKIAPSSWRRILESRGIPSNESL